VNGHAATCARVRPQVSGHARRSSRPARDRIGQAWSWLSDLAGLLAAIVVVMVAADALGDVRPATRRQPRTAAGDVVAGWPRG